MCIPTVVQFSFPLDYNVYITSNDAKLEFINAVYQTLFRFTLRVGAPTVFPGSIGFSVTVLDSFNPSDPSASELVAQIINAVNSGNFAIVYKGQTIFAQPGSGVMQAQSIASNAPGSGGNKLGDGAIAGFVVGAAVGLCLIALLAVVIYRRRQGASHVSPQPPSASTSTTIAVHAPAPNLPQQADRQGSSGAYESIL